MSGPAGVPHRPHVRGFVPIFSSLLLRELWVSVISVSRSFLISPGVLRATNQVAQDSSCALSFFWHPSLQIAAPQVRLPLPSLGACLSLCLGWFVSFQSLLRALHLRRGLRILRPPESFQVRFAVRTSPDLAAML